MTSASRAADTQGMRRTARSACWAVVKSSGGTEDSAPRPAAPTLPARPTAPSRLEGKSDTSLPGGSTGNSTGGSTGGSRASSLSTLQFLSPGSSFLTYQVSSGLVSSLGSLPSSQASSCQSIKVDGKMASGPPSHTSLQEGKAGDNVTASDQVTKGEQPA